jgi:hypothetical protein
VEPTEAEQAAATSGEATPAAADPAPTVGSRCSSLWAAMLARIYEIFPLVCANCGNEMRIISFITRPDAIERIRQHGYDDAIRSSPRSFPVLPYQFVHHGRLRERRQVPQVFIFAPEGRTGDGQGRTGDVVTLVTQRMLGRLHRHVST